MEQPYVIRHRTEVAPVPCPCGAATRVLTGRDNELLSVHFVDISADARPHLHRRLTEVYVCLEGEGHVELNGVREPVAPGTVILIRPGATHRALGNLKVLNIVLPPFDPDDETLVD
jgi:mannose-6-phosphate isomerase-like protein (cupin superfamily)